MSTTQTILMTIVLAFTFNIRIVEPHPQEMHESSEANYSHADDATHSKDALITGSGEFRFIYRPDLSKLPPHISEGLIRAHGGFAKASTGEVYFGLEGTGVVRLSPDLREKKLVSHADEIRQGGMHNTTYLEHDGGWLVLPDPTKGRIHLLRPDNSEIKTIGRPAINQYYADSSNSFAPTDVEFDKRGHLFVCDGYSAGKYVLRINLDTLDYESDYFGGPSNDTEQVPGKFSTNHGITLDSHSHTFLVADRESHWVQEFSSSGEFIDGIDMHGAMVCDVDFVDWQDKRLMIAGCLKGAEATPGVVHLLINRKIVSTLRPKRDLGLEQFHHIHSATGTIVDGRLFVLCYGWNPGCYAVLQHVNE